MKYKKFEEMPAWQDARIFVAKIYKVTQSKISNNFGLTNQLQRAALSILLNIAEGFEKKSNKDFARYINNAKASAGECRSALYVALDLNHVTEKFVLRFHRAKIRYPFSGR